MHAAPRLVTMLHRLALAIALVASALAVTSVTAAAPDSTTAEATREDVVPALTLPAEVS